MVEVILSQQFAGQRGCTRLAELSREDGTQSYNE
jgi:hypothetical protein